MGPIVEGSGQRSTGRSRNKEQRASPAVVYLRDKYREFVASALARTHSSRQMDEVRAKIIYLASDVESVNAPAAALLRAVAEAMVDEPSELASEPLELALSDHATRAGVNNISDDLGLSAKQLAQAAGVDADRQAQLTEMSEVLGRVSEWAGGRSQALSWYRSQPIAAFGGRTAESLVKSGQAEALRDYLDHIAVGGYA